MFMIAEIINGQLRMQKKKKKFVQRMDMFGDLFCFRRFFYGISTLKNKKKKWAFLSKIFFSKGRNGWRKERKTINITFGLIRVINLSFSLSLYIYIYIYTHAHAYIYIYKHTHIYIYIYTHIYKHAHTHVNIYIYIHTRTYKYTYTYTHIYIYTHTHIYAHIHYITNYIV